MFRLLSSARQVALLCLTAAEIHPIDLLPLGQNGAATAAAAETVETHDATGSRKGESTEALGAARGKLR